MGRHMWRSQLLVGPECGGQLRNGGLESLVQSLECQAEVGLVAI